MDFSTLWATQLDPRQQLRGSWTRGERRNQNTYTIFALLPTVKIPLILQTKNIDIRQVIQQRLIQFPQQESPQIKILLSSFFFFFFKWTLYPQILPKSVRHKTEFRDGFHETSEDPASQPEIRAHAHKPQRSILPEALEKLPPTGGFKTLPLNLVGFVGKGWRKQANLKCKRIGQKKAMNLRNECVLLDLRVQSRHQCCLSNQDGL